MFCEETWHDWVTCREEDAFTRIKRFYKLNTKSCSFFKMAYNLIRKYKYVYGKKEYQRYMKLFREMKFIESNITLPLISNEVKNIRWLWNDLFGFAHMEYHDSYDGDIIISLGMPFVNGYVCNPMPKMYRDCKKVMREDGGEITVDSTMPLYPREIEFRHPLSWCEPLVKGTRQSCQEYAPVYEHVNLCVSYNHGM